MRGGGSEEAFDLALTRSHWQVQFMASSPTMADCEETGDDLITAALRYLRVGMKRRHSGNIVIHHV